MVKDWLVFSSWKEKYDGVSALTGPFRDEPITNRTIFLWTEMAAPLPSGSSGGEWDYFPEPRILAAYLRFRLLPVYFEIWLVREDWDVKSEEFISAEELLLRASKSSKCRYEQDIPLMESLIQQLDDILRMDDDAIIIGGILRVVDAFNAKWENTGTWQFRIQVFSDPVSVGEEIYERKTGHEDEGEEIFEEEFDVNQSEWIDICSSAVSDAEAQDRFLQVLREDYLA